MRRPGSSDCGPGHRNGIYRRRRDLKLKDNVRERDRREALWVTGAIGTAVGLGSYDVAVRALSFINVATLWLRDPAQAGRQSIKRPPPTPPMSKAIGRDG